MHDLQARLVWGVGAFAMVGLMACGSGHGADVGGDGGAMDADVAVDGGTECAGKADGTTCGSDQICIGGACVESVCGDGVVDDTTEACDDGNQDPGDGCE